jgi:heme exporter protein C
MRRWSSSFPFLALATGVALFCSVYIIFQNTPNDAQLGFAQKIFYFHLPSAILGYLGFLICGVSSLIYLVKPSERLDVVAQAGAAVGVMFCAMVLISGPLWAWKSWGQAWTGEPRLVLTLTLFVIFCSYILVRSYGGRSGISRRIGAVLATFGLADIPLVHYATKFFRGNHPQVVFEGGGISEEMEAALLSGFIAFVLLFIVTFWLRVRVGMLAGAVEELHLEIGDRELLAEDIL